MPIRPSITENTVILVTSKEDSNRIIETTIAELDVAAGRNPLEVMYIKHFLQQFGKTEDQNYKYELYQFV